jgi:hypothetical protein
MSRDLGEITGLISPERQNEKTFRNLIEKPYAPIVLLYDSEKKEESIKQQFLDDKDNWLSTDSMSKFFNSIPVTFKNVYGEKNDAEISIARLGDTDKMNFDDFKINGKWDLQKTQAFLCDQIDYENRVKTVKDNGTTPTNQHILELQEAAIREGEYTENYRKGLLESYKLNDDQKYKKLDEFEKRVLHSNINPKECSFDKPLSEFSKDSSRGKYSTIMNYDNKHYASLTIVKEDKDAYVIYRDSLGHDLNEDLKEQIRQTLSPKKTHFAKQDQEQFDCKSCGYFALTNVLGDRLLSNEKIIDSFKRYEGLEDEKEKNKRIIKSLDEKIKYDYMQNDQTMNKPKEQTIESVESNTEVSSSLPQSKIDFGSEKEETVEPRSKTERGDSISAAETKGSELDGVYDIKNEDHRLKIQNLLNDTSKTKLRVYIIPKSKLQDYKEGKYRLTSQQTLENNDEARYFLDRICTLQNRFEKYASEERGDRLNDLKIRKNGESVFGDHQGSMTKGEYLKKKIHDLYHDPHETLKRTKEKHQNELDRLPSNEFELNSESREKRMDKIRSKLNATYFQNLQGNQLYPSPMKVGHPL